MVVMDESKFGVPRTFSAVRPARMLVVDDHPMFRQALRAVLERQAELEVVADVGSVAEAIGYVADHAIDAAIVDVVLPEARGATFVHHLRATQPRCKVLALSGVEEPTQMAEMLRAGAHGFALKSQPIGEILDALRSGLGGSRAVPAASREQLDTLLNSPDAWPLERLTRREREIFDLLVAGDSNNDIGTKLFISTRTVETHRRRIMTKLAAHSLHDLFQLALRHGLIGLCGKVGPS